MGCCTSRKNPSNSVPIGQTEEEKKEKELMDTIKKGNFEEIEKKITPREFQNCQSNSLRMGMKVNFELRRLAEKKGPDKERFNQLANSIEEFTISLLDPMRRDEGWRKQFGDHLLDGILDDAIEFEQKKFFTHPVVHDEMHRKWHGRENKYRKKWKYWQQVLSICCIFDLAFSLILFVLFSLLKKPTKEEASVGSTRGEIEERERLRRRMDLVADSYLLYLKIPYLKFVRDTLSYVTLLGLHYALCLAPSTVAFSGLEWAILIFFLGRFLVEHKQISDISQRLKRQRKKDNDGDQSKANYRRVFSIYLSDCWNKLDFFSLLVYSVIFILRISVVTSSGSVMNDRAVAIASYLYAFNTLCLTFRAFGHVMEQSKHVGTIQIALFSILSDIRIVFGQFVVAVLAFSFAIAKVYMAEQSYITNGSDAPDTNGSDAHDIVCKNSGISCWWAMFVHLSFSLVGLSEFHAMVTVDVPSETLALLLYAVFLGLGVILLINMLIALLSHTYQKTEDNALQEWAFKRAVTIEAYDDYDPIPVPLNIIYSLGKLLWQSISGRITNDSNTNSNTEPSGIEKSTFDELEKKYFAKHTNFFPLTDEKKLDQVLQETQRNKQMVSQILTTSFKAQGGYQGILCRGPEAWNVREGIRIEGHLLTCECKSCHKPYTKCYHGARGLEHFSPEFPHFEVTILETGNIRWPGIGVVDKKYNMSYMPGWDNESVGYHTDDGKIYHNDDYDGKETKGPSMARRGDLIRCTVMFERIKIDQNGYTQVPVCFTLNGRKIIQDGDDYFVDYTCSLYPYIGMTDGCSVLAKMCPKENKEYEVSRIAQIEKQLEETNRKLDILVARESARAKTWI